MSMTKVLTALRTPCTQYWALRATPLPSNRCYAAPMCFLLCLANTIKCNSPLQSTGMGAVSLARSICCLHAVLILNFKL
jgi:hypothetical protein